MCHPKTSPKTWGYAGHGYLSIQGRNKGEAKLQDLKIDSNLENKGIGSALLTLIEIWAKKYGVNKIVGNLSEVDANHLDKLRYFYNKHGYNFLMYEPEKIGDSIMIGKIEKDIK